MPLKLVINKIIKTLTLLFFGIFVFSCTPSKAQTIAVLEDLKINNQVGYNSTSSQFLNAIGNPTSTSSFVDEFSDITILRKIYGATEFHFYQDKLLYYYISTSNFTMYYQGTTLTYWQTNFLLHTITDQMAGLPCGLLILT